MGHSSIGCKRGLMVLYLFLHEWFSEAILLITEFLPKQIDFRMGVFKGHFIELFAVMIVYQSRLTRQLNDFECNNETASFYGN